MRHLFGRLLMLIGIISFLALPGISEANAPTPYIVELKEIDSSGNPTENPPPVLIRSLLPGVWQQGFLVLVEDPKYVAGDPIPLDQSLWSDVVQFGWLDTPQLSSAFAKLYSDSEDGSDTIWPNIPVGARVNAIAEVFAPGKDYVEWAPQRSLSQVGSYGMSFDMSYHIYSDADVVPVPASILLLGFGLIGFAGVRRKLRQ